MKKLIASIILMSSLVGAVAQSFTVTNTLVLTNVVTTVTTYTLNLVPVVSSAGSPMTNSSRWGAWIPQYIDAVIYTNGLTTNNVTDVKVLWTAPQNKVTYQERSIFQGMPDLWDGKSYIRLSLAKERILAGQRLHCLISIQDNNTMLTNIVKQPDAVWAANALMYKVIPIPTSKPSWLP